MRLVGQMHDIAVPLPDGDASTARSLRAIREAFSEAYSARYTSVYEGARIEAINFRVRCAGPAPDALAHRCGRRRRTPARRSRAPAGLVRAAACTRRRSTTATRCARRRDRRSRDHRGARGDHGRCRRATASAIDDSLQSAHRASARPAQPTPRSPPTCRWHEAVDRIEADPISLEIMWSRLVNVVEEMWLTVCRTAFSLVISEAQDFACELLDPDGETLAHSPARHAGVQPDPAARGEGAAGALSGRDAASPATC